MKHTFTFSQFLFEQTDPVEFWNKLSGKAQRHWLQAHPQSQYHDTSRFKLKGETEPGDDAETAAGLGRSHDEVLDNVRKRMGVSSAKDEKTEKTSKSEKSTGAKEVKGKSAQDVLASKDSPTDFKGPKDKKSSMSGNIAAEKKVVSEINKIAAWSSKIFKAEKALVKKYEDEGYKKDAAKKKAAQEMKADKEKYTLDLCTVSIPGTNLFCGKNKGIARKQMPQLKGNAVAGSDASKLEANADGEVSAEEEFKKHLKRNGVTMLHKKVDASSLKATQSQLVGTKVAGMYEALKKDPKHEAIGAPIFVSRDGYILDGHHRWAAHVALDLADGLDVPVAMDVIEVDMDIEELVDATNNFANSFGIAQKSGDGGKEKQPLKESNMSEEINTLRDKSFAEIVEAYGRGYRRSTGSGNRTGYKADPNFCSTSPTKKHQYDIEDKSSGFSEVWKCQYCGKLKKVTDED